MEPYKLEDAYMKPVKRFLLLTLIISLIGACTDNSIDKKEAIMLPPNKAVPEASREMLNSLIGTEDPQDHFPSQSKTANLDINTPEEAYSQLLKLYPEIGKKVECWTEFNNHYVFSLEVSEEIKNAYLYVVYVPIGGRKFSYFWPHT